MFRISDQVAPLTKSREPAHRTKRVRRIPNLKFRQRFLVRCIQVLAHPLRGDTELFRVARLETRYFFPTTRLRHFSEHLNPVDINAPILLE
jgi:hypothetical protein